MRYPPENFSVPEKPQEQAAFAPASGSAAEQRVAELEQLVELISRNIRDVNQLRKRVKEALEMSKKGYPIYLAKSYMNQMHFTEGQIDAFQAVLNWLEEKPQNNSSTETR